MPCRCGTSAYKSSSSDWKRKAATDAHTLSEYAELFGSDEAAVTEPAEAAVTQNGQSHANLELDCYPAADAAVDVHEQSKEVAIFEAIAGQTAVPKKNKKTKEGSLRDKGTAVTVGNQANVKKKKKGKKSEGTREKHESEPVTLLGVNAADAPWANEPVPDEVAAEGVTQRPAQTVKQFEQVHVGSQGKGQLEGLQSVKHALNKTQAFAMLGYGMGVKEKKGKKRQDC